MTENETTPALADPPIHQCPRPGSAIMPCCGRTPFEVPRVDGLTTEQYLVTCGELTDEDWQVWHAIHTVRIHRDFDLALDAVRTVFRPYIDGLLSALKGVAAVLELGTTKAQRRATRKAQRNAAEYSQPWAPGVITRKSRKR